MMQQGCSAMGTHWRFGTCCISLAAPEQQLHKPHNVQLLLPCMYLMLANTQQCYPTH
jgi:hypothetical protein